MSESKPRPSFIASAAIGLSHRFRRHLESAWRLFRGSKLGMAGLSLVLVFGFIAALAPIISPYHRDFEAPEADRFKIDVHSAALWENLTYNRPVMGPTTPLSSDRQGGVWLINSAQEGLISMHFLRHTLEVNVTPFQAGNISITLDITQAFGLDPPPRPPLTAAYFVVPGRNASLQTGSPVQNGALAFFAGRDFVVVDPFSKKFIGRERLSFDPVWTGEDPASAGEMLIAPLERVLVIGILTEELGVYRYFYAASPTHVTVFQVTYVHHRDLDPQPEVEVILDKDISLSAPPFVYYNGDRVTSQDRYRSGAGQAILLPLTNNTLEIWNTSGTAFRGWVPLTLGGEPAAVGGSIGFTRTSDPLWLYLPLRSSSYVGLGIFDLGNLRIRYEAVFPNAGWEHIGRPESYRARAIYAAFFDPNEGPEGTTHLLRFNETAVVTPQFQGIFEGRIRNFFEVHERSKIFVFPSDGGIRVIDTVFAGPDPVTPQPFSVVPPETATLFAYGGAIGGTLYGTGLVPQELYGVWTDPVRGDVVVFQLLGTIQTPLAPGCYPSGNCYRLGTDFRGQDILTHLFWGAQVAFIVGLLAALVAVGVGTLVGLLSGYYGRVVDTILMRMADMFLVLPFLPIVLILAAILRPSIWVIIMVIGIVGWPGISRVIRSQVLTLKERPFIDAARVSGASDLRLIFAHIGPNVLPFSFLYMSLGVAGAIITEAALSFLGLGDATVISWGGMLSQVLTFGGALSAWWWLLPPGLSITLLSLGFYMLGRGFDEIINPRLRRR